MPRSPQQLRWCLRTSPGSASPLSPRLFERLNATITRVVKESAEAILEKQRSATTLYLGKKISLAEKDMALLGDFLQSDACAATTSLDLSESVIKPEGLEALMPGLGRSRIASLK